MNKRDAKTLPVCKGKPEDKLLSAKQSGEISAICPALFIIPSFGFIYNPNFLKRL